MCDLISDVIKHYSASSQSESGPRYDWLVHTLNRNNSVSLPVHKALFVDEMNKMKNNIKQHHNSTFPETMALNAHLSNKSIREMWRYYTYIPGVSSDSGATQPGNSSEALTGAVVDDIGYNEYYPSLQLHEEGWDYAQPNVRRGTVLKMPGHYEALLVAPDMLYLMNSPLWPEGWKIGPLLPLSRSAGMSNWFTPFAIFDKCSEVKDTNDMKHIADRTQHHVQCGDFIQYLDDTTNMMENGIVVFIRVKRSASETARANIIDRIDRTFELNLHDHAVDESDEQKAASKANLISKIDPMVACSPSVTFIVMNCHYMISNGDNLQPDINNPLFAPAPSINVVRAARVEPPTEDRPPGMICEIRCRNIITVYTKVQVKVKWYKSQVTSYRERKLDKESALTYALPPSMRRYLSDMIYHIIHVEETLATGVMVEYLNAMSDVARNQLELARVDCGITDATLIDQDDVRQRDYYCRIVALVAEYGCDIANFKLLIRHTMVHDVDRGAKPPLPPVHHTSNWISLKEQMDIRNGKMMLDKDPDLTTEQKDRLLLLYGHTDRSSEPLSQVFIDEEKRKCANIRYQWLQQYECSFDKRMPRTKPMLLKVIEDNKDLQAGSAPKIVDWSAMDSSAKRAAREADPNLDMIAKAAAAREDEAAIDLTGTKTKDAEDDHSVTTPIKADSAASKSSTDGKKAKDILKADIDQEQGDDDDESQGDDPDASEKSDNNDDGDAYQQGGDDRGENDMRDIEEDDDEGEDEQDEDEQDEEDEESRPKRGRRRKPDDDDDDSDDSDSKPRKKSRRSPSPSVAAGTKRKGSTSSKESKSAAKKSKPTDGDSSDVSERFHELGRLYDDGITEQEKFTDDFKQINTIAQVYPGTTVKKDSGNPFHIWSTLCANESLPFHRFHAKMKSLKVKAGMQTDGKVNAQKMFKYELIMMSKFNPALYNVSYEI